MGQRQAMSILRSGSELGPDRIQSIVDDAIAELDRVAGEGIKGDFTIRDLQRHDLAAGTTNVWGETSGTAIAYITTAMADGSSLADETYIAIWGVRMSSPQSSESSATTYQALEASIGGIRITTGASLVAQWDFGNILTVVANDLGESVSYFPVPGYTEQPIIVTQNTPIKIEEYSNTTAADPYHMVILGAVAEKAGKVLAV